MNATVKEAVRQAIILATGIIDTQWHNSDAAGGWRQSPHIDLVLKTVRALGVDEYRHSYEGVSDTQVETIVGQRQFIVSVRIETETQADDSESVGTLSSLLRVRLRRKGVLALLRASEVALAEVHPTASGDFEADDRMVSLGVTDVLFSALETDTDDTSAGDYIEGVGVTSTEPESDFTVPDDFPVP